MADRRRVTEIFERSVAATDAYAKALLGPAVTIRQQYRRWFAEFHEQGR